MYRWSVVADLVGKKLDHFRIVAKLGAGGMGVVYKATDEKLHRTVAIKVLPPSLSEDADRRTRFLREARSAAAVTHANIAAFHEVGESEGLVFLVMEYVEGKSLRRVLEKGALPLDDAMRFARGIARGLAKAHERGIIHRDLKPDNVVIDEDREPKILDFGLAKLREQVAAETPGSESVAEQQETASQVTQEGRVLGTPGYMSPEQAKGKAVDARTDLFAFGVVLYEMLTGQRPFKGETTLDVNISVSRDVPEPVSRLNEAVTPELERIVERCLAKAAADRYANARDLVAALESIAPSSGASRTPAKALTPVAQGTPRRWPRIVVPLAIAAIAVGTFVVPQLVRSPSPPSRSASTAPVAASALATALTDYPPPKTSSPEAAKEYAQAMQGWRDAAFEAGEAHLQRALQLDPSFALAHLALAWSSNTSTDDQRKHLAVAVGLRSQLGERDQAILEALQASRGRDKPDVEDEVHRWKAIADRFPLDAGIVGYAGSVLANAGHKAEGYSLLDAAVDIDPKYALPFAMKANYQVDNGELDDAVASANRCLAISASATTCLRMRAGVEQRLGQCAKLEDDARLMIALEPGGKDAYGWLASALIARGAPIESVGEAERRMREVETPDVQVVHDAFSPIRLAWLTGDFASQMATFPALETFKAGQTSSSLVADAMGCQVLALDETGDRARAVAVAEAHLRRLPALTQDDPVGGRSVALWIEHLAGRISDAEFRSRREAWAKDAASRMPPRLANQAWFFFYGLTAVTAEDAREALDELPRYSPLPPYDGNVPFERAMGQVLLLAGRVDEAIAHLRRALTACFATDYLPGHQFAAELLGEALEAKGDPQGACAAYAEVLVHWGNAKPRSKTADAARAHMRKLGCAN